MFERGLEACGKDYPSNALWDKYMAYEAEVMHLAQQQQHQQEDGSAAPSSSVGSAEALVALYTRCLRHPLRDIDKYLSGWVHGVGLSGRK